MARILRDRKYLNLMCLHVRGELGIGWYMYLNCSHEWLVISHVNFMQSGSDIKCWPWWHTFWLGLLHDSLIDLFVEKSWHYGVTYIKPLFHMRVNKLSPATAWKLLFVSPTFKSVQPILSVFGPQICQAAILSFWYQRVTMILVLVLWRRTSSPKVLSAIRSLGGYLFLCHEHQPHVLSGWKASCKGRASTGYDRVHGHGVTRRTTANGLTVIFKLSSCSPSVILLIFIFFPPLFSFPLIIF